MGKSFTMGNPMKLATPWSTYFSEVEALFAKDPQVGVEYVDNPLAVNIYVTDHEKAYALTKILPTEKKFGNVTMKVTVVPTNFNNEYTESLFRKAFKGNPAFKDVVTVSGDFTFNATYVVFAGDVVQFYNDELNDLNGMKTMLYQDVARDVFEDNGLAVFYCTEKLS